MLQKMMQWFKLSKIGFTRFIYWSCILTNLITIWIGIIRGVRETIIIGLGSCFALTLLYYRLLPELKRSWEKIKIIWFLIFTGNQYYICLHPRKPEKPLKAAGSRCWVSENATPLFLSTCSEFAKKLSEESEKEFELTYLIVPGVKEMKKYLRSEINVYLINEGGDQKWCYQVRNKILTRQDHKSKYEELLLPDDLQKHWDKLGEDELFIVKKYERKER